MYQLAQPLQAVPHECGSGGEAALSYTRAVISEMLNEMEALWVKRVERGEEDCAALQQTQGTSRSRSRSRRVRTRAMSHPAALYNSRAPALRHRRAPPALHAAAGGPGLRSAGAKH